MLNRLHAFWPNGYQRRSLSEKKDKTNLFYRSVTVRSRNNDQHSFKKVTGKRRKTLRSSSRATKRPDGDRFKSQQNGDYYKQAMRKSCRLTGLEHKILPQDPTARKQSNVKH